MCVSNDKSTFTDIFPYVGNMELKQHCYKTVKKDKS